MSLSDGTVVEYIHDPLGRRIAKKVNGAVTEKYLWSGLTTLLAVYDGADALLMRFEYADGRMPVTVLKEGVTYYLAYDPVGSLRAVADGAGNVVKRIDYDAFGNIVEHTDPLFDIPFGFAGGLHDRDTGLVRFGYRDYDPGVGRWTAKDPIGFGGGDTDLYGYCINDPVNWIDPEGLGPCDAQMNLDGDAIPPVAGNPCRGGGGGGGARRCSTYPKNAPKSGKAPEYNAGTVTEDHFLNSADKYLGGKYKEVSPGRFQNAEKTRQVRYGNHETRNPNNHHGHFEALEGGHVTETSTVTIGP